MCGWALLILPSIPPARDHPPPPKTPLHSGAGTVQSAAPVVPAQLPTLSLSLSPPLSPSEWKERKKKKISLVIASPRFAQTPSIPSKFESPPPPHPPPVVRRARLSRKSLACMCPVGNHGKVCTIQCNYIHTYRVLEVGKPGNTRRERGGMHTQLTNCVLCRILDRVLICHFKYT